MVVLLLEVLVSVHACTIIARNYLPQARVLAASFRAQHPDGAITVLIIDDPSGQVDAEREPFEVVRLSQLHGDPVEIRRMAAIYDILEFSTALKPWLLATLIERGAPSATYLDPDIEVFAPLTDIEPLALNHDVVLTPHVTAPMPRDGKTISETSIMASGIYNLGFISVGKCSSTFLNFWKERLKRECLIQPERMRFVDQRWVDFVPGIYDTAIIKDPGYNVAYWNLGHRSLTWTSSRYEVTGQPLRFFHFSGYSPSMRHLLSKHQLDNPRVLLSRYPCVRRICDEYGDLLEGNGFGTGDSQVPYAFAQMANGIPMDRYIRRYYRMMVERADVGKGEYPSDPFDPEGADELVRQLNGRAEVYDGPARLTHYLGSVYAERLDLHAAFPDPQGRDFERLMGWARSEADAGRLDGRLVPEPPGAPENGTPSRGPSVVQWSPPDRLLPGLTVIGYLRAELGVGEWGRLAIRAIEKSGIPHATLVSTATGSRQEHPYEAADVQGELRYDTNLLCVNADQVPSVRATLGEACFAGRCTVGQWAWELEEFPERWRGSFALVDEVWAISEFTRSALSAVSDKPVFTVPPAIVVPDVDETLDRASLGLPEKRYLFLYVFDLLSVMERKNPLGLVDAFCRAFKRQDESGPLLVLKVINGDQRVGDMERLRLAVDGRPDIILIDRYFSSVEQAALMAACDCYVSLHRSEGFGLTMAEAMALGKPVIATGYSGNLDFMDDETAYLVRWDVGSVPSGCEPYRVGSRWADPDLDHAAELMQLVFRDPDAASRVGDRAKRSVSEKHGPAARAQLIRERFDAIQARRAQVISQVVSGGTRAKGQPTSLVEIARSRPDLTAVARRLPRVTRTVRRLVLRAQRHHDDHQRWINVTLARSMESLRHKLEEQVTSLTHTGEIVHKRLQQFEKNVADTVIGHERAIESLQEAIQGLESGPLVEMGRDAEHLQRQIIEVQQGLNELRVIPYMSDPELLMTTDPLGRPAIGYRHDGPVDDQDHNYAGFEDIFRGSEEFIRDRQRVYLPFLRDRSPVLDLGCGRGEMLDLLESIGVQAVGVDLDPSMVERCEKKGRTAERADLLEYLERQADGSIGAVFSAQVIEHLSYEQLLRLYEESYRVLEPEGLFIAETVNPHCVPAFKTFWTDLTHKVPIFPEVAVNQCRSAAFGEARIMFPNGSGSLEKDRWTEGEYAVIACKRPTSGGPSRGIATAAR